MNVSPSVAATDGARQTDRGVRVVSFVKGHRAQSVEDDEGWRADEVTPTLNQFDTGDARATVLVPEWVGALRAPSGGWRPQAEEHPPMIPGVMTTDDDPMNLPGLDSNRYRAIGNGVAAPCAEWIGRRLIDYLGRNDAAPTLR